MSRAALQQAAVIACGFTYTRAALVLNVSTRTIWSSVKAYRGSGRKPWDNRTDADKLAAVNEVHKLARQRLKGTQ